MCSHSKNLINFSSECTQASVNRKLRYTILDFLSMTPSYKFHSPRLINLISFSGVLKIVLFLSKLLYESCLNAMETLYETLSCNWLYILTHMILSVHDKDATRRFCFYLKRYIWLKVKETLTFCLWVCMVFRKILRTENQWIHVPLVSVVNLQTCFSVLCWGTPPQECNIAWVDISQ